EVQAGPNRRPGIAQRCRWSTGPPSPRDGIASEGAEHRRTRTWVGGPIVALPQWGAGLEKPRQLTAERLAGGLAGLVVAVGHGDERLTGPGAVGRQLAEGLGHDDRIGA